MPSLEMRIRIFQASKQPQSLTLRHGSGGVDTEMPDECTDVGSGFFDVELANA